MQEPISVLDVDAELWQVLDLCSDEELEAVYSVLHAPSPFSPVVKSLLAEKEPPLVEQRGRLSLMHRIESRFRFLAADQSSLLRGSRPSYRDALLSIRDRIDVPCSSNLSTFDLETELFLHVLNNCLEYVQGDEHISGSPSEAAACATMQDGDGMSSSAAHQPGSRRPNWVERVTAPILFGVKELVPTIAKLGSAITVTAVGRSTVSQLAQQLASSSMRYQAAARLCAAATSRGVASGAVGQWGRQAVLEGAAKGLQVATARYSALQGALSFIGPVMWGWLAVDLVYKSIGTDYARIIRAIFILAQVRLLKTMGFTNPPTSAGSPSSSPPPPTPRAPAKPSNPHGHVGGGGGTVVLTTLSPPAPPPAPSKATQAASAGVAAAAAAAVGAGRDEDAGAVPPSSMQVEGMAAEEQEAWGKRGEMGHHLQRALVLASQSDDVLDEDELQGLAAVAAQHGSEVLGEGLEDSEEVGDGLGQGRPPEPGGQGQGESMWWGGWWQPPGTPGGS